jgi:hypothetical protein
MTVNRAEVHICVRNKGEWWGWGQIW